MDDLSLPDQWTDGDALAPYRPRLGAHLATARGTGATSVRTITLPRGLDDRLQAHAAAQGATVREIVQAAVETYLRETAT